MKTYNGNLIADDLKMAIVVGRFNDFITNRLLSGALELRRITIWYAMKRPKVSPPLRLLRENRFFSVW